MAQVQLSAQQLAHAIGVFEGREAAKQRELNAYATLRDMAGAALADLLDLTKAQGYHGPLRLALTDLFTAKHTQAAYDLEEIQLQLKAMRQMQSGVVGVIANPALGLGRG